MPRLEKQQSVRGGFLLFLRGRRRGALLLLLLWASPNSFFFGSLQPRAPFCYGALSHRPATTVASLTNVRSGVIIVFIVRSSTPPPSEAAAAHTQKRGFVRHSSLGEQRNTHKNSKKKSHIGKARKRGSRQNMRWNMRVHRKKKPYSCALLAQPQDCRNFLLRMEK